MTDIPDDIMKLARSLAVDGFADYFNAPQKIAAALLAERKRCAAIVKAHGALDHGDRDVSDRVSEGAIEDIMKGGEE